MASKNNKKKTSWERQTSANYSLNSQTSQIKTGTGSGSKAAAAGVDAKWAGLPPVKEIQEQIFKRTGELQHVVFPR